MAAWAARGWLRSRNRSIDRGWLGLLQEHSGWAKRLQEWPHSKTGVGTGGCYATGEATAAVEPQEMRAVA